VAKEDPVPVCRVAVAVEVCGGRRNDFHSPASAGVPSRQALPDDADAGSPIDSRSTSDDPGCAVPFATDPYTYSEALGVSG
jgi:hypothetical protein